MKYYNITYIFIQYIFHIYCQRGGFHLNTVYSHLNAVSVMWIHSVDIIYSDWNTLSWTWPLTQRMVAEVAPQSCALYCSRFLADDRSYWCWVASVPAIPVLSKHWDPTCIHLPSQTHTHTHMCIHKCTHTFTQKLSLSLPLSFSLTLSVMIIIPHTLPIVNSIGGDTRFDFLLNTCFEAITLP